MARETIGKLSSIDSMTPSKSREATFCKSLGTALRNEGWFFQRIESAMTSKGIPDVYAVSPEGGPYWFELKNINRKHLDGGLENIPWRLGQQNWMYRLQTEYGQDCYTLVRFEDGMMVIPHNHYYENGNVDTGECRWFDTIKAFAVQFK